MSNIGRPRGSKNRESKALAVIRRFYPQAKSIRDATHSIHIEVTNRYVKGAKPEPNRCPLAKAAIHEMALDGALISRGVCYTIRGAQVERYVPGGITRDMLRKFDKTGSFEPGIYRLAVPPPSQELSARQARAPSPPNHGKKGVRLRNYILNGERRRLN